MFTKKNLFEIILFSPFVLFLILGSSFLLSVFPALSTLSESSVQTPLSRKEKEITLYAVGDVGLGRSINAFLKKEKDLSFPFKKVLGVLKPVDIVLVNLEGPFLKDCPVTTTGFRFCSEFDHVAVLTAGSVDIVNLANNHMGDYGDQGVKQTEEALTHQHISYTGLHNIAYKKVRDVTFSFVGFTDIPASSDLVSRATEEELKSLLSEARGTSDVVVSIFHWGEEYSKTPTIRQQELAHSSIEMGADIVIGHHPHWVQSLEVYQRKLIMYSLGNFVFDQMWSKETREGVIAKLTFQENFLTSYSFTPILIEQYGQPRLLEEKEESGVFDKLFPGKNDMVN
ncbi:MAG TPA: CapA family protein [Patescibacteria group bacterium]|nr:CapA family protein [Patescibacteria group bacterium]